MCESALNGHLKEPAQRTDSPLAARAPGAYHFFFTAAAATKKKIIKKINK